MELPEEVKIFLVESYENLDQVDQLLVDLETTPKDLELINKIFRSVHTIKGNAGFLGFANIETLCHRGEALLHKARNGEILLNDNAISALFRAIDLTRQLLNLVENAGNDAGQDAAASVSEITALLKE